jgi:hypothetical protein
MAGLNTRTGQRNAPAPSKYIPGVQAKASTAQGYAAVQSRLNQYQMGPPQRQPAQSQARSPFATQQVQAQQTPKASDVWGTSNTAGAQSENFMQSYLNFSRAMQGQTSAGMKDIGAFSNGQQMLAENNRSANTIAQNNASSNQTRITNRATITDNAFGAAQAYNERQMDANRLAGQTRDQAEALKQYQLNQQDVERSNATKNLAGTYAQTDAQIQAAQAAADANKYAASQSARASMFGSLSATLSPQQGWKYW